MMCSLNFKVRIIALFSFFANVAIVRDGIETRDPSKSSGDELRALQSTYRFL